MEFDSYTVTAPRSAIRARDLLMPGLIARACQHPGCATDLVIGYNFTTKGWVLQAVCFEHNLTKTVVYHTEYDDNTHTLVDAGLFQDRLLIFEHMMREYDVGGQKFSATKQNIFADGMRIANPSEREWAQAFGEKRTQKPKIDFLKINASLS